MLAGREGVMRVTSDGNQTLSRFKELKDCWELVSPVPDHALAFSLDGPLWLDLQEGTASRPQVLDERGCGWHRLPSRPTIVNPSKGRGGHPEQGGWCDGS